MHSVACSLLAAAFFFGGFAEAASVIAPSPASADVRVAYRTAEVDGIHIFYRESGPRDPAHARLSHIVAHVPGSYSGARGPLSRDRAGLPGLRLQRFPDAKRFHYSFDSYARMMERFTRHIGLYRYALYIQDYGAPVGLRLALLAPERVTALIVQNGNAYQEGLSKDWDPLRAYWRDPSPANREKLRGWLTADGIRLQYAAGLSADQAAQLSPDTWTLDWALLTRPGNIDVQLDLFGDYQTNVALYPEFQAFLRERRPLPVDAIPDPLGRTSDHPDYLSGAGAAGS